MKADTDEELKELAWSFFSFHAGQRLTTFNFYVAISALLATGMFTLYHDHDEVLGAGLGFGILLFVLSIIFWMLDQRNQALIELSVQALIEYEKLCKLPARKGKPSPRMIFSVEKYNQLHEKKPKLLGITIFRYRYSRLFPIIFFCFGNIGTFAAAVSTYLLLA